MSVLIRKVNESINKYLSIYLQIDRFFSTSAIHHRVSHGSFFLVDGDGLSTVSHGFGSYVARGEERRGVGWPCISALAIWNWVCWCWQIRVGYIYPYHPPVSEMIAYLFIAESLVSHA